MIVYVYKNADINKIYMQKKKKKLWKKTKGSLFFIFIFFLLASPESLHFTIVSILFCNMYLWTEVKKSLRFQNI